MSNSLRKGLVSKNKQERKVKSSDTLDRFDDTGLLNFVNKQGGQRAAARVLGVARTTLQSRVYSAQESIRTTAAIRNPLIQESPSKGVKTYIFSSAQDNTSLNERCLRFLENLKAYAAHLGNTEIHISGFTYQKGLFEDHSKEGGYYVPAVQPYLTLARMEIADKIAFCGEMNILPTAVRPLSGLETYTRHMWGVFPHPKIALESVATPKFAPAKQIMTTGCITPQNYVPKKAGLKAQFHHVIGALIVEVDADGDVFCRHLLADKKGDFQDLTTVVEEGVVQTGRRVHAVNWGDIHIEKMDPVSAKTCWGLTSAIETTPTSKPKERWEIDTKGSMLDTLRPYFQFFHDTSDFTPRNHHNISDPHFRFEMFSKDTDSVEDALYKAARFLQVTQRPWCESVVVESNHDLAYLKWLRTSDYRTDPVNALFFLESQQRVYQAIRDGDSDFSIFEWAMHRLVPGTQGCVFLREDDSFVILGDQSTGIECALHGHLGANGGRPSPASLSKIGPKLNIGHVHCFPAGYRANVKGKGFTDLAEIRKGDLVSAFNPDTQANEWTRVIDTPKGTYSGPLVSIRKADSLHQEVTDRHFLFLKDGSYLPISDAIVYRDSLDVPVCAEPMVCNDVELDISDTKLRQIVAAAADGSLSTTRNSIVFHLKKDRKKQRVVELFGASLTRNPTWQETAKAHKAMVSAYSEEAKYLSSVFADGKRLPSWFVNLSDRQAEVVLDEIRFWDGVYDTGSSGRQFSTSKEPEAYLVASLANRLGYRTTCKKIDSRDNRFHVSWCESDHFRPTRAWNINDKRRIDDWGVRTRQVEDETVFCLTTESQNFWVMSPVTGQVSLTGNSPYIRDGVYAAGIEGLLDQGYNKGASGWAQAEIITYDNSRRTLVTRVGEKWRAAR
jgi:hypothetical protein